MRCVLLIGRRMTVIIDIMHERGASNKMCVQLQSKVRLY